MTGIGITDVAGTGWAARACADRSQNAKDAEPSATAADFAAMMKKLAGPEMLWKEQAPEEVSENAEGDDTDARGVLASGEKRR